MKELLNNTEVKMQKSITALKNEYATIRAGRASASMLDKIMVEYYGVPTPINQMAAVSVPEARVLMITPWDMTTVPLINKAILASDLGITPTDDGKVIRLTFPQLTEERRKEITKTVSKYAEECKVAVRNSRRDAMDKAKVMKKDSEITEDDLKNLEKQIQTLTDKYCKEADDVCAAKEKEIMEI